VERELRTASDVGEAIRSLRVRGAPLIGIAAAWGVAALARGAAREGIAREALVTRVEAWSADLAGARPTAVNLAWALERMRQVLEDAGPATAVELAEALAAEAQAIRDEDARMCRRIGEHGRALIQDGARVLTHCNAGALATGGIGTALAPLYVAHEAGMAVRVFVGETRPLLQGSRLTAWELSRAGIDVTLLTDTAVGALFRQDPPDAVLVGADRIAANGDVANKVGTYALAVLARHHGTPFYVLAPTSTVDRATPDGAHIPIEHRSAAEVRAGFGGATAPAEVPVWNPAFDVTPAELVSGIVTEEGLSGPPYADSLRAALGRGRGGLE